MDWQPRTRGTRVHCRTLFLQLKSDDNDDDMMALTSQDWPSE